MSESDSILNGYIVAADRKLEEQASLIRGIVEALDMLRAEVERLNGLVSEIQEQANRLDAELYRVKELHEAPRY